MTLISKGDPGALARLEFNPGDLWIFAAVICYAGYTALMRRRPAVHPFSFLFVTFALGAAMILPFYLMESWNGHPFRPTAMALGATVYVALFPSILAYLCFNRLVAVAGPNRAGLCIHLVPVFGSLAGDPVPGRNASPVPHRRHRADRDGDLAGDARRLSALRARASQASACRRASAAAGRAGPDGSGGADGRGWCRWRAPPCGWCGTRRRS